MKRSNSVWLAQLALALAAACGGSSDMSQPPPSGSALKLVANPTLGNILVDGSGRTLYYFAKDLPAGGGKAATSNCTGSASDANSCVHFWPIFYAASPTIGAGLNAADFSQIVRTADGIRQTTYKGFPLYYFRGDMNPGEVHGESIPDWFVVRAPFYNVITLDGGTDRLTDGAGRTLYTFLADTVGTPPLSACEGTPGDRNTCVGNWPIFFAGDAIVTPTGLDPTRFTTFTRADDQKQTAFDGHPLYYFVDDASPGDVNGLTFPPGLGFWFTADPAQR